MRTKIFALGLMFGAGLCLALKAQESEKELGLLKKGKVLVHTERDSETKDFISVGRVIFPAPLETSWQVITDYRRYPEFLSDVREMVVEKRDDNQVLARMRLKNVWPIPDFKVLLVIEEFREAGIIRFQMKDGDFSRYYGSWKLTGFESKQTLAEYRFFRYVGWWWFPFVPDAISNNSIVRSQLNNFKKHIQEIQIENSLEPEKVIQPFWRKSIFKDLKKEQKEESVEKDSKDDKKDQKK